jgi:hypothetical protein
MIVTVTIGCGPLKAIRNASSRRLPVYTHTRLGLFSFLLVGCLFSLCSDLPTAESKLVESKLKLEDELIGFRRATMAIEFRGYRQRKLVDS